MMTRMRTKMRSQSTSLPSRSRSTLTTSRTSLPRVTADSMESHTCVSQNQSQLSVKCPRSGWLSLIAEIAKARCVDIGQAICKSTVVRLYVSPGHSHGYGCGACHSPWAWSMAMDHAHGPWTRPDRTKLAMLRIAAGQMMQRRTAQFRQRFCLIVFCIPHSDGIFLSHSGKYVRATSYIYDRKLALLYKYKFGCDYTLGTSRLYDHSLHAPI